MAKQMPDVSDFFAKKNSSPYVMQQTMVRCKDPMQSLKFYTEVLNMNLLSASDFPQWGFSVYFVGYVDPATLPADTVNRWEYVSKIPGTVELTWNHGTESEEAKVYNTGNGDTTGTADGQKVKGGFGHLGISVPDVYEACERFKEQGVEFHKSPNGGGMKGLAFIKDPDGYLIEVVPQGPFVKKEVDCMGVSLTASTTYKDNSK
jgi:lactoylglutathione lyase